MYVRIRGTSFGIKLYPNKSLFGNKKKKKQEEEEERKKIRSIFSLLIILLLFGFGVTPRLC
jgi:hypothetical protein